MGLVSNAVLVQGVTLKDLERMVKREVSQQLEEYKSQLPPPPPPQKAYIEKPPTTCIKRIEVAKLLRVNVSTIDDWTKAGFLRSYHIGRRVYYTHDDIEKEMGIKGSVGHRGGGYHLHQMSCSFRSFCSLPLKLLRIQMVLLLKE